MPNYKVFNRDKNLEIGGKVNVTSEIAQFDNIIAQERNNFIELKSTYGISVLRDVTIVANGGSVSNNATEYLVATGTNANASAILDSEERGRYIPGMTGEAGIGIRLPVIPTNTQEARWGYFDDNNGYFFGRDATGIFIDIRRAGTDTKIYQDNWNVDKLDGTGKSGINLNVAKGNIFQIIYTWYGYGVINFTVITSDKDNVQKQVIVHRYRPQEETSVADPNLPIRAQAINGATAPASGLNLYVGGRQYSVFGPFNPKRRITSERRLNVTAATSNFVPTVSFRRKDIFPPGSARANSVSCKVEGLDIIAEVDTIYEIRLAPTLTGTNFTTPTGTSPSETALLADTSATAVSGGELIYAGLINGGSFFSVGFAQIDELRLDYRTTTPVTLALRAINTTGTVDVVFRSKEEW